MNTWHYQLIKHVYPKGEITYGVHEYYPASDEMDETWTITPIALLGDSEKDVLWILNTALEDIKKHGVKEVKY